MAKTYTANFNKTINSVSASEFPLVLLELQRDDLAQPIRLVNDSTDLVHQGNTYTALPFEITLPDDPDTGMPVATLSIVNVGRVLATVMETTDWTKETSVKLTQVMRSAPDVAEWSITMMLVDIEMTSQFITGKLSFEDLLGVPAITKKYTPQSFPGLY